MTIQEVTGKYAIIGNNQDENGSEYTGVLELTLDENLKIIARWAINTNQEQFGSGFYKDNLLVVNFNYKGDDNKTYKGTVVYKFFDKDTFDGFWSEKHGNQQYLGLERGRRINTNTLYN